MSQKPHEQILWNLTEHHTARILRISGSVPVAVVPSQIAGYPVTELGSYCFAPECPLPSGFFIEEINHPDGYPAMLRELSGSYIRQVFLPDTLCGIGNYAFYNCRNLTSLAFGKELTALGSDAFMNCSRLSQLFIRCPPCGSSGLRQILAQISWDVEVSFYQTKDPDIPDPVDILASIFYPEYYESYDEITPAHVFGRSITGEGFRARHSFVNGAIDYTRYDTIFEKACAEESETTLSHLALCRLRYPQNLSADSKNQYETYLKTRGRTLCGWLVPIRHLDALSFLFHEKLLSMQDAEFAVTLASESGWTEGIASMIRWKQSVFPPSVQRKYEFDAF